MADLVRTDVVVTIDELSEIIGDPVEEIADGKDVIQVCVGEWRREPDGKWRAWEDPDA